MNLVRTLRIMIIYMGLTKKIYQNSIIPLKTWLGWSEMSFGILGRFLWVCLVDCNGNYIGMRICITRNTRCYNVMLITIHLFGDNIIIEPLK